MVEPVTVAIIVMAFVIVGLISAMLVYNSNIYILIIIDNIDI